ncbi:ABC transporter related [Pseudarthrobacter chlorophenolicus A6]|uniref:ABC transporter related n=1 Tax=Pseudarthrobacter chlorophenolicus (strain ATCC 700700 / DSM 12829 / CIP 107037 / JCM 12360 / KCTC 9906 / NCIMB 13794 / A6) TaxID=452863 RepID=B8HE63_PSECP|nr:ABC transporter ATP-binding protein [Pseudarthrobacter chlorophenolicus]ACL39098.1 ABC transporter related [Pseudarthrobacter chlorophenolicus A6]SDR04447.1 peptide/nickel transport system ATP-binding protein [Pseudarthrobacter chlorophenolicus]
MTASAETQPASPNSPKSAEQPLLEVRDFQVELITDTAIIRAVDAVSFTIHRGETVTIIGESGSGKSTTAMGILRLLPEDLAVLSGTVVIDGVDISADPKAINKVRGKTLALIPQDPMTALSPVHSIGGQLFEAIKIAGAASGKDKAALQARAVRLLEQVHIPTPEVQLKKYPHQLSGGMLQRVLIAIALASEPQLLVADEPTSALDVTVQGGILDLLLELQEQRGIGILMITHDLGVARLISDRIHVMKDGAFVESGDVQQIVDHPATEYTQTLLAAVPVLGPWDETPTASGRRAAGATSTTTDPALTETGAKP